MSEHRFKAGDHIRVIHRLPTATFKAEGEIVSVRKGGGYYVTAYQQPGRIFVAADDEVEPYVEPPHAT